MTRISINGYEPAHLSFSTVSALRMCGKKFELTKILRKEEKPGLAAIGGNAVHVATEQYDLGLWTPSLPLDPKGSQVGVPAEIAASESRHTGVSEVDNVRAGVDDGGTDEGSGA